MTIVVSTKINQINPTKLNTLVEEIMKKSNDNDRQNLTKDNMCTILFIA